ncbi:hypothetical protein DV515_00010098, partial [Chloebia gouldiae]
MGHNLRQISSPALLPERGAGCDSRLSSSGEDQNWQSCILHDQALLPSGPFHLQQQLLQWARERNILALRVPTPRALWHSEPVHNQEIQKFLLQLHLCRGTDVVGSGPGTLSPDFFSHRDISSTEIEDGKGPYYVDQKLNMDQERDLKLGRDSPGVDDKGFAENWLFFDKVSMGESALKLHWTFSYSFKHQTRIYYLYGFMIGSIPKLLRELPGGKCNEATSAPPGPIPETQKRTGTAATKWSKLNTGLELQLQVLHQHLDPTHLHFILKLCHPDSDYSKLLLLASLTNSDCWLFLLEYDCRGFSEITTQELTPLPPDK